MDLGARVKKALYDPEETVASHGEVDQHKTPGAYPDTPANESGPDAADPTSVFGSSQTKHNKLHKREDPRGWTGDSNAGLSHKHADSGVGLTGEHDAFSSSSSTQQHQPGMIPGMEHGSGGGAYTHSAPNTTGVGAPPPTATHGLEQQNRQQSPWAEGAADVKSDPYRGATLGGIVPLLDSHRDTEMREDSQQQQQPSGTTTNKDIANAGLTNVGNTHTGNTNLGGTNTGTTDTSSTDHGVAHKTRQPEDVVQDHPYWGDLPHGGGVYNSVTGHGSEEDQKKRQQELYQQETQGLSGQHPSTVAGLSDSSRDATSYQTTTGGLTGSHGDASKLGEREDSSHRNEALMGAGGAATASAAAATAYKMHDRDNTTSDKAPLHEQQHSSGERKERRKSFGLFNRSKEDDHHHKDKTKHTDESKPEKKHSFGGLFHRSSGDKESHDDSTAREVRRDEVDRKHHDDSNTAAYTMAGAGAGLGAGGAAYLATRDRKDDKDDVKDKSALGGHQHHHHHQPESMVHEHQQKQSYGTHTEPQHQYQDASQHTTRGYDEQDSKHSRNMTGAAAATAAGLGAGAVASRHRNDEPRDEQIKTRQQLPESETRGAYANTTSVNPMVGSSLTSGNTHTDNQPPALTDHANRGDYSHLSSGTASGVEPMMGSSSATDNTRANKQPSTLTDHANRGDYSHLTSGTASGVEPMISSSSTTSDSRTKQAPPAIAGHANHAEYNLLSSGTPSGVRLDEDSTDNKDKSSFQPQHTIPETRDQKHDNSRTTAAGLGAAGLGAAAAGGAAAYQSRDRGHDSQEAERKEFEKLKPAEEDQVKRFEREEARGKDQSEARTFPLVPGAGGESHKMDKVIHRCRKCGEENDITSYVTQGRH